MSAALQLPVVWGAAGAQAEWPQVRQKQQNPAPRQAPAHSKPRPAEPDASLAFYRKHTESMLRRYLYASMQVGRAPSVLSDSVGRGWVSSHPIRTFEDAVIFVLDVETCLNKLGALDRQMLSRIVLQEYTQTEAAALIGMGVRTISYKFPQALDRLTQLLLEAGLLILPH
jgi:DNA-directed RNA polymerase specialized sigma24 family protein